MTRERRHYERTQISARMQFQHGNTLHTGSLIDLSGGGLQLSCVDPPPLHSKVRLFVPIPKANSQRDRLCLAAGNVSWTSKNRAGIKFGELPDETRAVLNEFVRSSGLIRPRRRSPTPLQSTKTHRAQQHSQSPEAPTEERVNLREALRSRRSVIADAATIGVVAAAKKHGVPANLAETWVRTDAARKKR